MIEIPTIAIVLLVLFACTREFYHVFRMHQYENLGTLFSFTYMAVIYGMITWGDDWGLAFHGSPFVRVGIFLIFLDKAIAFGYEILTGEHFKWKI